MARNESDAQRGHSALFLAIFFVALAIAFVGYAVWRNAPRHLSLITITASGTVTTTPDQANIYVFLNATGASASSAIANLSTSTSMLNSTLLPLLNDNSSFIKTLSYSVYVPGPCVNASPTYYSNPYYCIKPNSPKFYVASEYLLVTLPDVNTVDRALTQIAAIQGVGIGSVGPMLSMQQQTELNQKALMLALDNATNQAQALAGSNASLVMENITVVSYFFPVFAGSGLVPSAQSQTFFKGTMGVTKSINVVFSVQ